MISRIKLWLLKRAVAKQPVPSDTRDAINTLWKYEQYSKLEELAKDMYSKIHA